MAGPPMNPAGIQDVDQIPKDAVAVLVFREHCGPQPTTIIVTKASYENFLERMVADGGIKLEETYEFESPKAPKGRRSRFWFTRVVGITCNYDTGVLG